MKNSRVLISDASIAGPSLAYWLHRYRSRSPSRRKLPRSAVLAKQSTSKDRFTWKWCAGWVSLTR